MSYELSALAILRINEVIKLTGLSKTAIYLKAAPNSRHHDATFPTPVALGARNIGYYEHEVKEWLRNLPRATPAARSLKMAPAKEAKRRKRAEQAAAGGEG